MAYFLRVIRQTRWFGEDEVDWLGPGEVPGDALRDLNQSQGGTCICRVLGIGAGVSRECFGP